VAGRQIITAGCVEEPAVIGSITAGCVAAPIIFRCAYPSTGSEDYSLPVWLIPAVMQPAVMTESVVVNLLQKKHRSKTTTKTLY
jgi:hypothetical protein